MKEAQESKCQNLKCKACGKALSLRCHFSWSILSFVYIGFKQLRYLLHNVLYCQLFVWLIMWRYLGICGLMSSQQIVRVFSTNDCYKLGNVHSLQLAMK